MTFNVQAFQAIPVPEDFIEDMRRYQRLIQIKYENSIRSIFIYTLDSFEEQLGSVWDLVMRSVRKELAKNQTFNKPSKKLLSDVHEELDSDDCIRAYSSMREYLFLEEDINTMSRDAVLLSRITRAKTLQLRCALTYDREKKEFAVSPDPEVWQADVSKSVMKCLSELE